MCHQDPFRISQSLNPSFPNILVVWGFYGVEEVIQMNLFGKVGVLLIDRVTRMTSLFARLDRL